MCSLDENDTAADGEGNGSFHFETWLSQYKLTEIKDSFIENDMITLNTLSLDNDNFHKLMLDGRVLGKAHLIPNIIKAINSLKHKQKESEAHMHRLVFMTEKEQEILSKTQCYLDELINHEHEINNKIKIELETKKYECGEKFREYKQYNLSVLNKMDQDVDRVFTELYEALQQKQTAIKSKIQKHISTVNNTEMKYHSIINAMDANVGNLATFIENGKAYYKDAIKKYHNACNTHYDQSYDINSKNHKREKDICNIGNSVNETYVLNHSILSKNLNDINNFINAKLQTDDEKTERYSLSLDNETYNIVCDNNRLMFNIKESDDYMHKFIKTYENEVNTDGFIAYEDGVCSDEKCNAVQQAYVPHMSIEDAVKLKVGDTIDYMDKVGRHLSATIQEKNGTQLKLQYEGWPTKWDTWSDYQRNIHRFAIFGSISLRPAHRLQSIKKGCFVQLNPVRHSGEWRRAEVRKRVGGQVHAKYAHGDRIYWEWVHLDNVDRVAAAETNY